MEYQINVFVDKIFSKMPLSILYILRGSNQFFVQLKNDNAVIKGTSKVPQTARL